jgi:hypothetical protein
MLLRIVNEEGIIAGGKSNIRFQRTMRMESFLASRERIFFLRTISIMSEDKRLDVLKYYSIIAWPP